MLIYSRNINEKSVFKSDKYGIYTINLINDDKRVFLQHDLAIFIVNE